MMLSDEQKEKIVKALNERIGGFECPMCHKGPFTIIDGYFNIPLQSSLYSYLMGNTTVPMVAIACSNCGYVSFHALGALGLLDRATKNRESEATRSENDTD